MTKETREFITQLLLRELHAEYVNDNPNPLEVEYVVDLIKASRDFVKNDPINAIIIEEAIGLLERKPKV